MAKEIPSVGDLRRKLRVTDEEIEVATAAYRKDENAKPLVVRAGSFEPSVLDQQATLVDRHSGRPSGSGRQA